MLGTNELNSNQIGNGESDLSDGNNACDIIMMASNELSDSVVMENDAQIEIEENSSENRNAKDRSKLYLTNLQIHTHNRNEENAVNMVNNGEDNGAEEGENAGDLVHVTASDCQLIESSQHNRMRVALGIILRLVVPLANGVAKGLKGIRDVRILRALRNLASSRQSLTNMLAYAANTISMSLSSVQVAHRIDPLLKLMKIRRGECIESLPDLPSSRLSTPSSSIPTTPIIREPRSESSSSFAEFQQKSEKFCTINVLAEPPPGVPIRADIVLIHGLHGSLANTWKQGMWNSNRSPVNFERPPKPPLRPPKRPRHSRSNIFAPPHTTKRARFADREHFAFSVDAEPLERDANEFNGYNSEGESPDISYCDGIEYSFPTFRLRMDDEESNHSPSTESTPRKESNASTTSPQYSKCWPGDWLPLDCPGVRVIALNYTTDPYLWRPVWKKKEQRTNLAERAHEMTELLIEKRVGYGHPIVWVGHSKGGIFVKQIIVDAWESGRPAAAPFWRSARGVFFYSVPHRGSHLATINPPFLRRSVELIEVEKNSKYLLDLHRRFAGLYQLGHLKIEVFSFVETALTFMAVLYLRIVGVDSADPGIGEVCGLHLDHREICKPRSRECILYTELINMINKVC